MGCSPFGDNKILVTGASGFIGSHLCRRLCKSGAEVHGISRHKRNSSENGLHWWQGDLTDISTVRKLLNTLKPDLIFHLATHGAGARDLELVLPTFQNGLVTTVNLLNVATEFGFSRLILPSSLEEPDMGNGNIAPSSPYAAAKWASSTYARMFHELYKAPIVILRIFMTYGPGQPLNKIIPYVILSLLQGQSPKLSSGQRQVDWVYIDDVVNGLLTAAHVEDAEGSTIDLGSGELVQIRTVVEKIVNLIDPEIKPLFGALPDRPLEQVRVAETVKSNALIGWKPVVSLEEGLKRTVNWYKERVQRSEL